MYPTPPETADREEIRLSEVLSALSFVLDIVEGQPKGHVVRSCFIGMTIGERLGLRDERLSALFYALLLKDAGCSSNAAKVTALFDADDFGVKRDMRTVDWARLPQAALYMARSVSPEGSIWNRARRFLTVSFKGKKATRELFHIRCERGADISRLIGFPEETARAIRSLDEHWDGGGHPDSLEGDRIPLLARICGLAQTAEVFYNNFGPTEAEEVAKVRQGKWFDPELVDIFLAETRSGTMWENLARPDLAYVVSSLEPADRALTATPERLDLTARAFARIIDAKSPYTYEHSERVAETAAAIGEHLGLPDRAVQDLTRAGLLHDIGKLGISNRVLDKPGRLTDAEFSEVKRHPALTHETLSRVPPFRNIADTAANHHEKLDGSGYHRGVTGESLDLPSRILTVADIFDALSSDRPYRSGMPLEKVLAILNEEGGEKLSPESVLALEELVSKGVVGTNHATASG